MTKGLDTPAARSLTSRLYLFALAGLAGFAVDATILLALVHQDLDIRLARLISFACALVVTWLINRSFAFGDRAGTPSLAEFAQYASASALAGLINLGVFTMLVTLYGPFAETPVLAAALATGVSMSVNFWSYLTIVFAPRTS
ncbi:GtrA family protein [Labrys okinawensis]|uniref:GtrA family protein n=1 Tax=Labrys okinawensis TaxID=346911 RepID=UPI0039BD887C